MRSLVAPARRTAINAPRRSPAASPSARSSARRSLAPRSGSGASFVWRPTNGPMPAEVEPARLTGSRRPAAAAVVRSVPLRPMPTPSSSAIRGSSRCPRPRSGAASSSSSRSAATRSCPAPASSRPATRRSSSRTRAWSSSRTSSPAPRSGRYNRAVDYQRVLRVAGKHNDFEEVGRTPRHHTFFEMLGNWSFGDYFKREAIHWAWDFLTQDLGIPGERLAATTYTDDEVAWNIWRDEIGLPPERMAKWGDVDAGDDKNFWRMADTGPVRSLQRDPLRPRRPPLGGPALHPGPQRALPALARDLEPRVHGVRPAPGRPRRRCRSRASTPAWAWSALASVLQQVPSNYDTDLFPPIHDRMRELLGHDPEAFEAGALQLPGHRGPLAGDDVPHRRRRPAVERGPRLRPAPDPPASRPPRPAARAARAVPRRDRRTVVIDDHGRGVSRTSSSGGTRSWRRSSREEAPVRSDARRRDGSCSRRRSRSSARCRADDRPAGGGPAGRRAGAAGRRRVPAARHVRLPDRPDRRAGRRVRRGASTATASSAALSEQRERSRSGKKAELAQHAELAALYQRDPRPGRRHGVPRLRDDDAPRVASSRSSGTGIEFDELTGQGAAEVVLDRTPFYAEGGGQVGDHGELREAGGGSSSSPSRTPSGRSAG